MDEYKRKALAWLAFAAQLVNGLVLIVQNIPATGNVSELFSNGTTKNVVPQILLGFGLYLAQSFLPRLQRRKL